jgi:hypothetical protein
MCPIVLLEIFHALGRDEQLRVVATLHQLLLNEVPRREFEVLARPADQVLQIRGEGSRIYRLEAPIVRYSALFP